MTGNATEEWLLTRLDYPGHLDAGRLAGLSGAVAGITVGLVAGAWLPAVAAAALGLGAAFLVGTPVYRVLKRRAAARKAAAATEARARHEEMTKAQIALMKTGKAGGAPPDDDMRKG